MTSESFDVVIVGSGMAGAAAAQQFCEAGLKVLVVEAGAAMSPASTSEAGSVPDSTNQQIQARCYAFGNNTHEYFVRDTDDPYCTPSDRPFSWIRARAVGGKSLLWAGHCYRMEDLDFRAAQLDGVGAVWPLTYRELAPYYDRAETILQVRCAHDVAPGDERRLTDAEARLQSAFAGKGRKLIAAQVSHSQAQPGIRGPCLFCGQTTEECLRPVNSRDSTLAAALKTGLLTLWTQSPVRSVTINSSGKATGVAGVRRSTGELFEATGRIIFLCASALESTRILLNSKSAIFPDGLGNSGGALGHYLMDHVSGIVLTAILQGDEGFKKENARAGMFYLPRCQNLGDRRDHAFLRGYGYQVFTMRADHELLPCARTQMKSDREMTAKLRTSDAQIVQLIGFGEMLPHYDNYVEIDREGRKDACGIPVLRIDCRHQENEIAMAEDMVSGGLELLQAAGATVTDVKGVPWEPGLAIHEAGTCRMGDDPRTSVLNRFNQCHDVPNVFVTDGSSFPSIGVQNPALTIMALTLRACDHAIHQLR
jgi:choline dehydrogenase-like flavoprotein